MVPAADVGTLETQVAEVVLSPEQEGAPASQMCVQRGVLHPSCWNSQLWTWLWSKATGGSGGIAHR